MPRDNKRTRNETYESLLNQAIASYESGNTIDALTQFQTLALILQEGGRQAQSYLSEVKSYIHKIENPELYVVNERQAMKVALVKKAYETEQLALQTQAKTIKQDAQDLMKNKHFEQAINLYSMLANIYQQLESTKPSQKADNAWDLAMAYIEFSYQAPTPEIKQERESQAIALLQNAKDLYPKICKQDITDCQTWIDYLALIQNQSSTSDSDSDKEIHQQAAECYQKAEHNYEKACQAIHALRVHAVPEGGIPEEILKNGYLNALQFLDKALRSLGKKRELMPLDDDDKQLQEYALSHKKLINRKLIEFNLVDDLTSEATLQSSTDLKSLPPKKRFLMQWQAEKDQQQDEMKVALLGKRKR